MIAISALHPILLHLRRRLDGLLAIVFPQVTAVRFSRRHNEACPHRLFEHVIAAEVNVKCRARALQRKRAGSAGANFPSPTRQLRPSASPHPVTHLPPAPTHWTTPTHQCQPAKLINIISEYLHDFFNPRPASSPVRRPEGLATNPTAPRSSSLHTCANRVCLDCRPLHRASCLSSRLACARPVAIPSLRRHQSLHPASPTD